MGKGLVRAFCVAFSAMLVFSAAFSAQAKSSAELNKEKDKIEAEIEEQEKSFPRLNHRPPISRIMLIPLW